MMRLLCLGFGYSARTLARRLSPRARQIIGTATSAAAAAEVAALGHRGIIFDGTHKEGVLGEAISQATHILVSAPPGEAGDPFLFHHCADIAAAAGVCWIGYLSTVGVYGDRQGGWVDETTLPLPGSARSRRRLAAEEAWRRLAQENGIAIDVFRLAGIYGAGRSAIDSLRAGRARRIIKAGQVFNRIHVEDIAAVVEAAMRQPGEVRIFNVADDEPAPPQDVIAYAAKLIGVPVPPDIPYEEAQLSSMAASFYDENKRVCNALISRELGVRLAYPTYREGLSALARAR